MEWLTWIRDPLWQFVGVLLAVVVPLLIVWIQSTRKRLSSELETFVALVSRHHQHAVGKLEVRYQGEVLNDPQLVVIRVMNSGKVPITTSDIEEPIRFCFAGTKIVTAEVVRRVPSNHPSEITISGDEAVLSRALLNVGDAISCQFLLAERPKQYCVTARIVGVKDIQQVKENRWIALVFGLAFAVLGAGIATISPRPSRQIAPAEFPYVIATIVCLLVALASLTYQLRNILRRARRYGIVAPSLDTK